MGLSDPTGLFLQNLALRRARQEQEAAQVQGASQQAIGVLQGEAQREDAQQKEQAANTMRLRQITDEEKQNDVANTMRLQQIHDENANRAVEIQNQRQAQAASEANANAQTDIARQREQREQAATQQGLIDKQRADAEKRVARAVAAHIAINGPHGDINDVMEKVAGQPGMESITPEDVVAERSQQLQTLADHARAEGRKDEAIEIEKQKAADEKSLGYSRIASEQKIASERNQTEIATAGIRAEATNAKAGQRNADDVHNIDSGIALASDIKKRAQGVVGAHQALAGTLQDAGADGHDILSKVAGAVGTRMQTPQEAALETDVSNFILHSSKALEGTKRAVGEHQITEIRKRALSALHSGDIDKLNAELDALTDAMKAERAGITGASEAAPSTTAAPAATDARRPNPF